MDPFPSVPVLRGQLRLHQVPPTGAQVNIPCQSSNCYIKDIMHTSNFPVASFFSFLFFFFFGLPMSFLYPIQILHFAIFCQLIFLLLCFFKNSCITGKCDKQRISKTKINIFTSLFPYICLCLLAQVYRSLSLTPVFEVIAVRVLGGGQSHCRWD